MRKTIGVWLRLLLGLSLVGAAAGQQQSGVTGPPKVLVISREFLKPGHAGAMHEKTESAFVQAMARANWPSHYLAMDSLSGKLRSIFASSFDSLADWEKDNRATARNASLSSALDQAALADGNQLDSYDQSVLVYDEDLSLRAPVDIPHMRYMEIQVFRVKPGHMREFVESVKMVKDTFDKAVPEAHWATFRLLYGGAVGTYAIFVPMKSLSEADDMLGEGKKFAAAAGEDGMKKLSDLVAASIESRETNLFSFNPRMSYVPPAWVNADPGYWKPQVKMPGSSGANKTPAGQQ
jgi:hypothetical protein